MAVLHPENKAPAGDWRGQIARVIGYGRRQRQPRGQAAEYLHQWWSTRWFALVVWIAMAASLALFYRGGQTPLILTGLLLFGGLALTRPDLALLFVPLTAPLFLVSATLPGTALARLRRPPHELALLATGAAVVAQAAIQLSCWKVRRPTVPDFRRMLAWLPTWAVAYAPELLLLAAGVLGLLLGAPEPEARRDALRAFRWFVFEPLLFVALVQLMARRAPSPIAGSHYKQRLAVALIVGGAAVAALGLLQYSGYDLLARPAPLAVHGDFAIGAWRATSVYGNPNNLGLYLGRIWPLAAALALATGHGDPARRRAAVGYGLCALLCLGGILVSFSRGAWMGSGAALIVLALPYVQRRLGSRLLAGLLVGSAAFVLVGALMFALRGGPAGGSATVRLLFWRESVELIGQHPLGVGPDQFFYYHNPAYGRSLIDPTLANTQERDARQPHNLILELWLNLGPLGLLAFAWLLARGLRRASAPPSTPEYALEHGAIAALVAALTHGTVDAFYFWPDLAIAFWLLLALLRRPTKHLPIVMR